MNKKELREERLNKHYACLEKLAKLTGAKITDGKKLSLKLLKIEKAFSKQSEKYCNGVIDQKEYDVIYDKTRTEVYQIFPDINGFYLNTDPRGYALKIDLSRLPEDVRSEYFNIGFERDWGGYIILSPEIE